MCPIQLSVYLLYLKVLSEETFHTKQKYCHIQTAFYRCVFVLTNLVKQNIQTIVIILYLTKKDNSTEI